MENRGQQGTQHGAKRSFLNEKELTWIAVVGCLVVGVAVLIWPEFLKEVTMFALAGGLIVLGVIKVSQYFKTPPALGVRSYSMAAGLISITAGGLILADRSMLEDLVPRIWAVLLMLGGFVKVQDATDSKRMKLSVWWIFLVAALISIALGVVSFLNPAFIQERIKLFIGISLIVEGVMDLIVLILKRKNKGQKNLKNGQVPVSGQS